MSAISNGSGQVLNVVNTNQFRMTLRMKTLANPSLNQPNDQRVMGSGVEDANPGQSEAESPIDQPMRGDDND